MRINSVTLETCPGCGRPFDGPAAGLNEMKSTDGMGLVYVPLCKRCLTVSRRGARKARAALDERLSKAINAVRRGIAACDRREAALKWPGRG